MGKNIIAGGREERGEMESNCIRPVGLLAAVDRRGKHLERRKQGWPRAFVAPLNGLIGPLGGTTRPTWWKLINL